MPTLKNPNKLPPLTSGNNGSPQNYPSGAQGNTKKSDFPITSKDLTGSSTEDYMREYFNHHNDVNNDTWQFFFQNLWNRQNAQISEDWARQDAEAAFQRSLMGAEFNSQLSLAQQQKMYQQLIAMGMSPAAAMSAVSGSAGGVGSGAAGAQAATQGIAGASNRGSTSADRLNAASNMLTAVSGAANDIANTVNNIYTSNKQLNQNARQLDLTEKAMLINQHQFEAANWLSIGLAGVSSSNGYKGMWNDVVDYLNRPDVDASALTDPRSFLRHVASSNDAAAKKIFATYNEGKKHYSHFWDSKFAQDYSGISNSLSDGYRLGLQQLAVKQAKLDYRISKVNFDKLSADRDWFRDRYDDYKLTRTTFNDLTLGRLQMDLDELNVVKNDPELYASHLQRIKDDEDYQNLSSAVNKIVYGEYKEQYVDDPEYKSALALSKLLDEAGVSGTEAGAVAVTGSLISASMHGDPVIGGRSADGKNYLYNGAYLQIRQDRHGREYVYDFVRNQRLYVDDLDKLRK